MTRNELEWRAEGKIHHHAIFTLRDGTTKEGYMQPWDDYKVYLTDLTGKTGGSITLSDIVDVKFPEG